MDHQFIKGLELSVRAQNALTALKVERMDQFMRIKEKDITGLRNCGRLTWQEVQSMQQYFRSAARGEGDLATMNAMLADINSLRLRHPYFHIVITANGLLRAVDTRPEAEGQTDG